MSKFNIQQTIMWLVWVWIDFVNFEKVNHNVLLSLFPSLSSNTDEKAVGRQQGETQLVGDPPGMSQNVLATQIDLRARSVVVYSIYYWY